MERYQQWLRIAEESGEALALGEPAANRCWTFSQLRREAEGRLRSRENLVVARGNTAEFVIQTLVAWRDGAVLLPCESDVTPEPVPRVPDGVCHVKQTSGSTGRPRTVWFTADQLKADVDHIVSTMGLRPEWPNLGVISLAHSYGFSNLVLPLLLHGIPLILAPDALPGTMERVLAKHQAVTLPAVPAMWRAWLGGNILSQGQVHLAISAGAPLTLSLEQAVFEKTGLKIHNFYGSTECGGIAYDRSEKPRTAAHLVGAALDGVALDVVDGRLEVKSAAVGLGYGDGGAADDGLSAGRFLTSDEAIMGSKGEVFLQGRHGEAINIAGRKVAPQPIEEILLGVSGVEQALVFGVPSKDAERVEELVAVVRLGAGIPVAPVAAEANEKLQGWQRPRHWWACDALRPDVRGKISRVAWRRRFLDERGLADA